MSWPKPVLTKDTSFFWEAARERRLVIQRCKGCGVLRHPPKPSCPSCLSFDWDTVDSAGRGTVLTYTVVHRPLVPPFTEPYAAGLIELEEGTRLVASIVGVPLDEIEIGMPVMVDFDRKDDELTLPVFRKAEVAA